MENKIITQEDLSDDTRKCRVHCCIYITDFSLCDFASKMKKLSEKYKDYKIEIFNKEMNSVKIGNNLLFNIIKD